MYRSLLETVRPLIISHATGRLDIVHEMPADAKIVLFNGLVSGIFFQDLVGMNALKAMVKTVSFCSFFSKNAMEKVPDQKIEAIRVMQLISRIDKFIDPFRKKIGGNLAVFQFNKRAIQKGKEFSPVELRISFALDGNATIRQVIEKTGLSELEILVTVYRFIQNNAASLVSSHSPLAEGKIDDYLEALEEALADITGPVAPVIIEQSVKAFGCPVQHLALCDLPLLVASVQYHLDSDEKTELVETLCSDRLWTNIISA